MTGSEHLEKKAPPMTIFPTLCRTVIFLKCRWPAAALVALAGLLFLPASSPGQVIRCADPECPICLAQPGMVSPEKSDTREPRHRPEDAPFGREGSLAVVNPVLRSPQQTAVSLAGDWEFCTDPESVGVREEWMNPGATWPETVAMPVPSNWESHGIGEPGMSTPWICSWDQCPRPMRNIYIGSAWYRKAMAVPAEWEGRRVWLKVGGVRAQGWFWVNGVPVARAFSYCGAYKYEITDLVRPGETATIVAQVRNDVPSRTGQVSSCHIWGGIYRDIELESTPGIFLDNVECRGNFDEKNIDLQCRIGHAGDARGKTVDLEVNLRRFDPNHPAGSSPGLAKERFTVTLGEGDATTLSGKMTPSEFFPWSPETPNLYVAEVTLYDVGGTTPRHGWTERFGIKKMEVRGDRFFLNGKPCLLRGYGDDYVYPTTFISPADRDAHRKNLRIARECGFTYVRHHTHSEIPEYYDAADELGIMVQPELPYYPFNGFHTVELFDFDPKRDLNELIDHYRRYVSLTTYSMGNEGHLGTPLDVEMKNLVHERDPGRLVLHNDGGVNTPENSDFDTPNSYCWKFHPLPSIVPWEPGAFDYVKMPFVAHEYMNLGLKFDPRISDRFTGAMMPPRPMAVYESRLAELGIDRHWGDACLDAGHAMQKYYQKEGIEAARLDPQCDGYSYWTLVDVIVKYGGEHDFTGQGMFNAFWEPKSNGATPRDVAKFNGPTAILMKLEDREHPILVAGETMRASVFVSHFGDGDLYDAKIFWAIKSGETSLLEGTLDHVNLQTGDVAKVGEVQFVVPERNRAEHWRLELQLAGTGVANDWDFWAFPRREKKTLQGVAVTPGLFETLAKRYDGLLKAGTPEGDAAAVVVGKPDDPEIAKAVAAGKRVVMLGDADGPPNVNLGWWTIANQTGTAFAKHPAFGDFPHDGYISPLWFRLIKEGMPIAKSMPLENPEYLALGEGRNDYFLYAAQSTAGANGKVLRTHGLDLLAEHPEAVFLLDQMLEYAASETFQPKK